jgi:hypothetical protein
MLEACPMQQQRGILAHIPATIDVVATRSATWRWLDDAGRPEPGTEYPVRIDVLRVRQHRNLDGPMIHYHVQAFRLGQREQMIATELFCGGRALRPALAFMRAGWAAFEKVA